MPTAQHTMSFADLGLAHWLCDSLQAMRIHTPTDVQTHCIPPILKGRNCIGGARTGSGKTLAFAGPMLTEWSRDPAALFGVVLTPTRELAVQIHEQLCALGAQLNIRCALVVGGGDFVQQSLELQGRPHFIVATPGRLAHHIISDTPEAALSSLLKRYTRYLVLDEADFLLTPTFASDLAVILGALPDKTHRRTLLFTATVTDQVLQLREGDAFVYNAEDDSQLAPGRRQLPDTLTAEYLLVPEHVKEAYLYHILVSNEFEDSTAVVFVNRTRTAELLRRTLYQLGVRVTSLHSQMPQSERANSLHRFRARAARVLVATDVAARGLDIPQVSLVVNYDVPSDPDTFVHRVGRTARAGRHGESVLFVTQRDVDRLHAIETRVATTIGQFSRVGDTAVIKKSLTQTSKAKRTAMMAMEREGFGERRAQQKLRQAK
ncbi:ATP-dependent RNA helicase DBP8 KNAG_0K00400 [Huiozyma naganishii CBS 8797]|uniref:RNA helicase n=1 Tax=Huiozyma naganishii (strain ATCC MYA-139 / BCRC 22969 / CBS 8797 / KCTC 17520 / NBRC 10181 / NCYC 3082 / Yp74L-3) TaxID=1071383 RepID=J7RRC3_HUIN7|nr:hypothetical protein KNAG_0K00400 [Kazachstania naganishii CBS 8797]CCK72408.1 hypothetical protein KNAG_0K00400 [Kazachstania naganishii CBS 8797]